MIESLPRSRRKWLLLVLLLAVAVPLTGALYRRMSAEADDPEGLLRQALGSSDASQPALATSRSIVVVGENSSGEPVEAGIASVQSKSGRVVGLVPQLKEPLKEGETVTLKLPGGGSIAVGAVPTEGTTASTSERSHQP